MSKQEITDQLRSATEQADQYALAPHDAHKTLVELLQRTGTYDLFDNHMIHRVGSSGSAHTLEAFARGLVRRAAVVGPQTALDEVDRYLASDEMQLERVLLLHDIHIDEPYEFSNGVRLIDIEELPDSPLRDQLVRQRWVTQIGWRVDAVLITELTAKKDIRAQDDERRTDWTAFNEEVARGKRLDDTRLLLSLARHADCGIAALAGTTLVPAALSFLESGLDYNPFPEPHTAFGPQIIGIEMQLAERYIQAFDALDEGTRDRFRIALKRLNDTKIDQDWANKAINLRICLENIFLNPDEENKQRQRIEERAPSMTSFTKTRARNVYGLLSRAVHTGTSAHHPEIDERMIAAEVQKVLRQILTEGQYPVWTDATEKKKSSRGGWVNKICQRFRDKS